MLGQILHKTFAVTLSLLVLMSTLSITIEKHFCGDVLVDVSVFSEVKKCGMETSEKALTTITKKSCCKDTIDIVEGQDELSLKTFEDVELDQQQFLVAFVYTHSRLFESFPPKTIRYKDYSPPPLIKDIIILNEVFLI